MCAIASIQTSAGAIMLKIPISTAGKRIIRAICLRIHIREDACGRRPAFIATVTTIMHLY
jgi:hypothetical protein